MKSCFKACAGPRLIPGSRMPYSLSTRDPGTARRSGVWKGGEGHGDQASGLPALRQGSGDWFTGVVRIAPLFAPPDKRHWHGATTTTAMSHIAIREQLNGSPVTWMEHVADEQYLAGPLQC